MEPVERQLALLPGHRDDFTKVLEVRANPEEMWEWYPGH
jgi:hypothetical protein